MMALLKNKWALAAVLAAAAVLSYVGIIIRVGTQ